MPSPLEVAFQQMVESMNVAEEPTFQTILNLLYNVRFTGAITLHCSNGVPKQVDLGRPVRIDLTRPGTRSARSDEVHP